MIDSFIKNQEVLLKLDIYPEFGQTPQFILEISVKDIKYRYYQTINFKMQNQLKGKFIYNHPSSTDVFVCLKSDREINVNLSLDAKMRN